MARVKCNADLGSRTLSIFSIPEEEEGGRRSSRSKRLVCRRAFLERCIVDWKTRLLQKKEQETSAVTNKLYTVGKKILKDYRAFLRLLLTTRFAVHELKSPRRVV